MPAESTSVTGSVPTNQSCISFNSDGELEYRYDLHALMIQETGKQRGQYRRIGTLMTNSKDLENASERSPGTPSDHEGSGSPDRNWNGGEDFRPGLVDETKCVEIRVDEAGNKCYIIDIV